MCIYIPCPVLLCNAITAVHSHCRASITLHETSTVELLLEAHRLIHPYIAGASITLLFTFVLMLVKHRLFLFFHSFIVSLSFFCTTPSNNSEVFSVAECLTTIDFSITLSFSYLFSCFVIFHLSGV